MHNDTNNTALVSFLNQQASSASASLPLSFFKSGQFLSLTTNCQGGIILQKPFYADFVGLGAAVGSSFDVNCTSVYVIGAVKFCASTTYSERQQAFQKRMAYSQQLQEIAEVEAPLDRALLILRQLCEWVGAEEAKKIPEELVARLVGLLPKTVEFARKTYPPRTPMLQTLRE
jgi:hypothetical protein